MSERWKSMMSHNHKVLLAAWWALAVTGLAAHAWALSCAEPVESAVLELESVTVNDEPATNLDAYDDLAVSVDASYGDGIYLRSADYTERMIKETP